jgi:hypothetical protein
MRPIDVPYRHEDLNRIVALLEARLAAGLPWNLSAADVRQVLPRETTDTTCNGRVWEDASGRALGFCLVWPPTHTLQLLVHPAFDPDRGGDPALLYAMLSWANTRAAEIARERGEAVTLHARPREDAPSLHGSLAHSGKSVR